MLEYRVPFTKILKVEPHPNADRLDICTVYNFQVITSKDKYKVNDNVIYIPIDSILDERLEKILFPIDSKVKLTKSRVRQIKIRSMYSQGMLIDANEIKSLIDVTNSQLEDDLSTVLNVTKYEPPQNKSLNLPKDRRLRASKGNSHFRKFNGIDNIKWFVEPFQENEEVVVQCKIHGTHVRFGKAPFEANTFFKKIKKLLGLISKYENVYGSNNVEISNNFTYTGFYGEDVYGNVLKRNNVFDKIKDGEFVHGEIYGDGIQKNYKYGCGPGEQKLIIFDVRVMNDDGLTQKWLDPEQVEIYAKERGFDFVPVLYKGPFKREYVSSLAKGPSVLCPQEPIREGCVVKARYNYDDAQNKRCFKIINEDYLADKSNTDFH